MGLTTRTGWRRTIAWSLVPATVAATVGAANTLIDHHRRRA